MHPRGLIEELGLVVVNVEGYVSSLINRKLDIVLFISIQVLVQQVRLLKLRSAFKVDYWQVRIEDVSSAYGQSAAEHNGSS